MIRLVIILGTKREGRRSERALQYLMKHVEEREDIEAEVIDPRDYSDLIPDQPHPELNPKFEAADAFLIISPEYNHSIPADLKELLDTDTDAYNHKPVAIAGVSSGPWGGTRMIEALIAVLKDFNMYVLNRDMHFPLMKEFDENVPDARLDKEINGALDELLLVAPVLKTLRS